MKRVLKALLHIIGYLALFIGIIGLFWVLPASIEARAYNRVTGSDVTTWEAMFLRLRVDCRGVER